MVVLMDVEAIFDWEKRKSLEGFSFENREVSHQVMDFYRSKKDIFAREVYLVEKAVKVEFFKKYGLFLNSVSKEEIEEMYYQYLMEYHNILEQYSILVVNSGVEKEQEVITGISLPKVKLTSDKSPFSISITTSPYLGDGSRIHYMHSTNFFVFGEKKKVEISDISEYVNLFMQKENYDAFLQMLLTHMESGVFLKDYTKLPYLPNELLSYYSKEFCFGKGMVDFPKNSALSRIRKK